MRLTGVPLPFPKGPRGGFIRAIKEIHAFCGVSLKDAKAIADRVRGGEEVNLTLLPRVNFREAVNAFLGAGCSVHPEGDAPSREQISEVNDEALFSDGFDAALIGYVERFGQQPLALYDRKKCIEILMEDDECDCGNHPCEGCVYERAVEHFDFNVTGAWVGENTPAFATLLTRDDA